MAGKMEFFVGEYLKKCEERLEALLQKKIIERIWEKDFTVWNSSPSEITNRLGWLNSVQTTRAMIPEINRFVDELRNEGFTNALLMGMGGSSLAPEVFRKTFGVKDGYLDLAVLDSTDPAAVKYFTEILDPQKTLYIVSTKSGGTVETMSFMKYFFNYVSEQIGQEAANHFIAITDPGSGLEETAKLLKFRKIFLNDPDIGGRFSALSLFGCVPAAIVGVDLDKLLNRAGSMAANNSLNQKENSGAMLGAAIGEFALSKVNKLTFVLSNQISSFGSWVEQLVAESTGKTGKGVLPVDLESVESPEFYSEDRLFVYIKIKGDSLYDGKISSLKVSGFPVIEIELNDIYDLGAEFFRWEFATAICGHVIGIQPFDQPNVESAKILGRKIIQDYSEKGKIPEPIPALTENGIRVYGQINASSIKEALTTFFKDIEKGKSYVSLQAYLNPDDILTSSLQVFRTRIQKKFRVATTFGYGPRFLHSTGQLHKGDDGSGFFIQFIGDIPVDVPIPDEAGALGSTITFGILKTAQALGDKQALIENNRNVITIDLGNEYLKKIDYLITAFE
ncbi:MAG: glucose-6-phosphate isomerase [Ignavibacteriaceae bacterium]|nr:glucose-6-phosphate isomerase [Ignavibacteriaceae bacterium]